VALGGIRWQLLLINNAGFGLNGKYHENPAEQEFALLQLNVVTLAQLTRLLLPGMVARGWGRILNVASTAAFQPGPHMAGYFASKAYVLSLSEALAYELKDTGVSVTVLCPGPTQTEFVERAGIGESLLFKLSKQSAEKVANIGYKAMLNGETLVISGLHNWALAQSMRFVPRSVARAVASWLVK
jgi:short-subunit dehydrogenase